MCPLEAVSLPVGVALGAHHLERADEAGRALGEVTGPPIVVALVDRVDKNVDPVNRAEAGDVHVGKGATALVVSAVASAGEVPTIPPVVIAASTDIAKRIDGDARLVMIMTVGQARLVVGVDLHRKVAPGDSAVNDALARISSKA